MNDVDVRNVTYRDLSACYTVESRCFFPSEAAPKENIEKRIKMFPEGFFVAEVNGTVIGHVNSAATNKDDITDEEFKAMIGHEKHGKNIVIFSLAVLPEFRGRGIAGKLMITFIEEAKKLDKKKILLLCKSELIAYYEKYGFIYGAESASKHGGFNWHEMFLALKTRSALS